VTTFIYSLSDPRTGAIRYVGKSNDLAYRYKTHFRREHSKKGRWVAGLAKQGLRPVMDVLDTVPLSEWAFWEQHWIQVVSGWGFRLLNMDNGGLGRGRTSPELAAKIAATLRGKPATRAKREIHSYALTGEYIESFPSLSAAVVALGASHGNICRAMRARHSAYGRGWSYDRLERLDLPNFVNGAYVQPEDVRRRIGITSSRVQKGRVFSADTRAKMSIAAKNRRKRERAALAL
jgi:hypothetical protein